ncbi:MAG: [protein-PII] uridylyltransferase [Myxococcota bacterium]
MAFSDISSTFPSIVEQLTRNYLAERESSADALREGADGLEIARRLASATDAWIAELWCHAATDDIREHTALLALGGYGRAEMCFGSDVDLMIEVLDDTLLTADALRNSVEKLMTWCRDSRISLGHSVRTARQTEEEFQADPRTPISLIDARELEHEKLASPSRDWAASAAEFLRGDDQGVQFVEQLIEGYQARRSKRGQTVYLLEPDIKSGEGGLRDLNYLQWGARVRWDLDIRRDTDEDVGWRPEHRAKFERGLEWILHLRHLLHLEHDRKHDRLNFPDQEALANAMVEDSAAPEDVNRRAEALMREHYSEAREISMLTQRFLRRWRLDEPRESKRVDEGFCLSGGQLTFCTPEDQPDLDDLEVLEALEIASEHGALLDPVLEMHLADIAEHWDGSHRQNRKLNARLLALLTDPAISEKTSERLLENGILTALIPEFEPIVCHVQHDVYHVYTTDIHSLKCLEMGRQLVGPGEFETRWRFFCRVAGEIEDTTVFLMACLCHDIGKNRGGDHSRLGARMMTDIGRRLGMSDEQVDKLAFLVREHLTLSDTARRRDIADPRVIRDLAGRVRTVEALNQLTALTFCDMSTVGPDVMTDWNASLLLEMYKKLRQALEHGVEHLWKDRHDQVEEKRKRLLELAEQGADDDHGELRSKVDEFVRDMPTDYLISHSVDALIRPFEAYHAVRSAEGAAIVATPMTDRGVTEFVVATQDIPGTLAKIAGTLSASGLNIRTAEVATTASGMSNDVFQVSQSAGRAGRYGAAEETALTDTRRIEQVCERLQAVLSGEQDVEELLTRRLNERRLAPRPTPSVETSVRVHQDQSDSFTVIEVRAPDRLGLLYEIAKTLWEQGVSTHFSKIDSLGTKIIDTFYVESVDGGKLDDDVADALVDALRSTLDESPLLESTQT